MARKAVLTIGIAIIASIGVASNAQAVTPDEGNCTADFEMAAVYTPAVPPTTSPPEALGSLTLAVTNGLCEFPTSPGSTGPRGRYECDGTASYAGNQEAIVLRNINLECTLKAGTCTTGGACPGTIEWTFPLGFAEETMPISSFGEWSFGMFVGLTATVSVDGTTSGYTGTCNGDDWIVQSTGLTGSFEGAQHGCSFHKFP